MRPCEVKGRKATFHLKDGKVIEVSTESVQFVDITITGRNAKGEPIYD